MNIESDWEISYPGRHSFGLGDPIFCIRPVGQLGVSTEQLHQQIQEVLAMAFNTEEPGSIAAQLKSNPDLNSGVTVTLDQINWGYDELVYLAYMRGIHHTNYLTLLINQPGQPINLVRARCQNLLDLSYIDPQHVIAPMAWYEHGNYGVYATPYLKNARCIYAAGGNWGMFDPQPSYHYLPFGNNVAEAIQEAMIAILVKLYDHETSRGITSTRLCGDDFIIGEQWDDTDPHTVMDNITLISVRERAYIPYQEYLDRLRWEFSCGTKLEDDRVKSGDFLINHKSKYPIPSGIIERGIKIGQQMQ